MGSEAEVCDFEHSFVQEDVGWLEIAVDDVVAVQFGQSQQNLPQDQDCIVLLERPPPRDVGIQTSPAAVFHHQNFALFVLEDVIQLDDVGTVAFLQQVLLTLQISD